jgi:hypothetical protein
MNLIDAQRAIATNWLDVYQQLPQRAPATAAPTATSAPVQGSPSGIQITSISSAPPGGRASVTVQTTPGASCSIRYRTPAGTSSTAQGLTSRSADPNGVLELERRTIDTARLGACDSHLQRREREQSHPDRLTQDLASNRCGRTSWHHHFGWTVAREDR